MEQRGCISRFSVPCPEHPPQLLARIHSMWLACARQDAAADAQSSQRQIAQQSASKEFHVVAKKDDVHEVALDGRTCQITFR